MEPSFASVSLRHVADADRGSIKAVSGGGHHRRAEDNGFIGEWILQLQGSFVKRCKLISSHTHGTRGRGRVGVRKTRAVSSQVAAYCITE
jgi:hypothetical protein